MDRYQNLFRKNEGIFIPFVVLGDPDPETSYKIIEGLIENGADALELGLPFSDPIADGPVIQRAGQRALKAGVRVKDCLTIVKNIREKYPDIPIGLLVYANLVLARGMETFFLALSEVGVDGVLIADVPLKESYPFKAAAEQAGIHLTVILPLDAAKDVVRRAAVASSGYIYLLSRKGVTGVDQRAGLPSKDLIEYLHQIEAPPPVLGFGISSPDQVTKALKAGCSGVISGSAVVQRVEDYVNGVAPLENVYVFVKNMKAATRP